MGEQIPYTVRRSDRARRVRVRVDPDGRVEVVLPRRAPERAAAEAIVELRPWVARRLREADATRARLAARAGVPYLGATLALLPEPGRTRVHRRGDTLLIPAEDPKPALARWYRRAARAEIEPRAELAAARVGRPIARLTIREQRTRWGSCTREGALSFNWRLLLAPEPVLDYVVWHEACHLIVLDHSPRFWSLVAEHFPGYKEQRRWLRQHGAELVL